MVTSERANKRRRLSKEPDEPHGTPTKAKGQAALTTSAGRPTRTTKTASSGDATPGAISARDEAGAEPVEARKRITSARKSTGGIAPRATNGSLDAPRQSLRRQPEPAVQVVTDGARSSKDPTEPAGATQDEAGSTGSGDEDEDGEEEPITRDTFLKNEQLKRQREARNFVYSGEADAPKLTRSGRVVASVIALTDSNHATQIPSLPDTPSKIAAQISAGAGTARTPSRRAAIDSTPATPSMLDLNTPTKDSPAPGLRSTAAPKGKKLGGAASIRQLPPGARPYLEHTMAILTGSRDMAGGGPMPFEAEQANETLHTLTNVLRGTVCRGEGNSALLVGPRGAGKTRTLNRALQLLSHGHSSMNTSESSTNGPPVPPIIVRLSGHAQSSDRLAIREMGRQIALAEGHAAAEEGEEEDEDYAPTTLPSHLLALLTAPSPRAIVVVMEEFDLFTEHARQALLYCLLDVVQSIKTGPVESTGRGVALIGISSRTDTLLLLEKRVKSRFSHRVMRVTSPLAPGGLVVPDGEKAWRVLTKRALLPWLDPLPVSSSESADDGKGDDRETERWKSDWAFAIDMLLKQDKVVRHFDRLTSLTTDVRNLYRPFIPLIPLVLSSTNDFLSIPQLTTSLLAQVDGAGWGIANAKLKGLSQPALTILVAAKHLNYAGKEEFNFAQVNEEYVRFVRTRLVGSGRGRWVEGVLQRAFDQVIDLGFLIPMSNATIKPHFARYRCTLSTHEIVAWFKGEGANSLSPELGNWGRMMGGHA